MTSEEAIAALSGQQDPAMARLFAQPKEQLMKLAGDVVPLPIIPGPMAGHPDAVGAPNGIQARTMIGMDHPGAMDVHTVPSSLINQYYRRMMTHGR